MWNFMVDYYGVENLEKLPLKKVLEVAWWLYNNPVNEDRIREIFLEFKVPFKEMWGHDE